MPTPSNADLKLWMTERVGRIEKFADNTLTGSGHIPEELLEAMRYALLGGGKRIRALLCYAAGAAVGARDNDLDWAAYALELVHAYSLVHDDMPAMDNDTLRRGKPTVHVKYGEALAMLTGDALQTEAFYAISRMEKPVVASRLLRTLSLAAGMRGMCGGQALDLAMVGGSPSEAELLVMQSLKTGALIKAAVLCGAQAGEWDHLGEDAKKGLEEYSELIGLAFQIVDDILDCTQDTSVLGKTAGKDEENDKPTWVSLLGLEEAGKRTSILYERALESLRSVERDSSVSSGATEKLRYIAKTIIQRTH